MQATSMEKYKRPRLANVKKMSLEFPDRCHYWEEEIKLMKVGDIAKVANEHERFWVVVKEITPKYISGEVNNILIMSPSPQLGEKIIFKRENIYETWDLEEFKAYYKSQQEDKETAS